jgi:hypothetical protein
MVRRILISIAALFLFASAAAQEPAPFDGKWLAKFSTERGEAREAVLNVKGTSGTWQVQTRARGNPCVGLEAPVTATVVSASELELKFHNSKALTGCTDNGAKVRRVDDKTLEGTLDDGRKVSLVRQ